MLAKLREQEVRELFELSKAWVFEGGPPILGSVRIDCSWLAVKNGF